MKKVIIAVLTLTPFVASAQALDGIQRLVLAIGQIVSSALPIVVGLALLVFFWGLVKFIFSQGNEDAKEKGKDLMIWGIVALFVMIAVWGIVEWIAGALEINTGGSVTPPGVDGL